MRILAYRTSTNSSQVLLEESTDERITSDQPATLFAFLLEPSGNDDWQPQFDRCIRVAWDLDATVAPILKLLGRTRCLKLMQSHRCYLAPFNVFYIPGKIFSITHIPTKARFSLYDLQQYFPELPEPVDLLEIQMLGEKLLYELKKMGLEPTKLTSPVAIYEECVMQYLDLPRVSDMPVEVAEYAYQCSGKLWIEAHQLGYWGKVYDYDMSSAFPTVAKGLADTRLLKWVKSAKYQPEAVYGYAKCKVTINAGVMVSPIIRREENGDLVSPTGTWEEYLTKGELDFITEYTIGQYEILTGWWGIPSKREIKTPLAIPLTKLLKYREGTGVQSALAKRMSAGVYGKMGEERAEEFGPYFNPCWFAEISTRVRLDVAEWLYQHGIGPGDNEGYKHLIHIGVDGVLLDAQPTLPHQ